MTRAAIVFLSVLLVLAGLVLGAWFLSGKRTTPELAVEASPAEDAVRAMEELVAEEPAGRESHAPAARREPALAAAVETVSEPDAPVVPVVLTGTAVRVDAQADEYAGEDGSFGFVWRRGPVREDLEVEVVKGQWTAEVPPDAMLFVRDLVLGGVPVTLEPDEFTVPPDRFLELRGRGLQAVLLHVLSESDGSELSGVEVWPGPEAFPTPIRHPGSEPQGTPVVRDAASPFRVPPGENAWRSASQYFVRAPGHAWGSIDLDHATGGERILELAPAAALEVELIGNAAWLEPEVRLWPPGASQWDAYPRAKRTPDADDRAVFESLAPGTFLVSVERGWADRRVSYGSATVDVVAGERLAVQVQVDLPRKPEVVRVAGTLTLPLAWEREGLELILGGEGATEMWLEQLDLPLSSMQRRSEGPEDCEVYAWEVELPLPGSYRLVVPLLFRTLLEVPPGGLQDVAVVVPPPADVEVRVLDTSSGDEIPVESLYWSLPRVEGVLATPLHAAVLDPEVGRVVFRAPAGAISIDPADRSILRVDEGELFTVKPGPNLVELEVQRLIGVRFTFRDGEATIPWDWSWRLSAHRVDGEGRDRARSVGILWFQEGGSYELRSEGIPGFQSIDGTRIDVRPGRGMIDVEVPLVRE